MTPYVLNNLSDLGGLLAEIYTSRTSAYLQVVRKTGPFIGIGILEGMIVYMKSGAAEGRDVVPIIGQIQSGDRVVCWPPRQHQVSPTLPDMSSVFDVLKTPMPALEPQTYGTSRVSPVQVVPNRVTRGVTDRSQFMVMLRPVMLQYLGPIADVVLEDVMRAYSASLSGNDSTAIIRKVAADLKDPARSRQFIAAAEAQVKSLF